LTASRAVGVAGSPLHRVSVDAIVLLPVHFILAAALRWAHDTAGHAVVRAHGPGASVDVAVREGTGRDVER
jgi:hypothetical protein